MKNALARLVSGELPCILVGRDDLPDKTIFLPGSFNPLHKGHEELLRVAEKTSGREGILELSVTNVDKPPLSIVEVERRLLQMKGAYPIVLTSAPTFAEKAELFPGAWFALGYDTAIRLLSEKYHPAIPAMLFRFQAMETRFIVGGRVVDGIFQTLEKLPVPSEFESLFLPIPGNRFREDISSTELRARQ